MNSKLFRFAVIGCIGFVADALVFSVLFYLADTPIMVARVIAFVCAATVTWFGNRIFTFQNTEQKVAQQWIKFMCGASFSALPNFLVFKLLSSVLGEAGSGPLSALVAGILVGMVSNYLLSSRWVFAQVGIKRAE
ncbi:GtrA family protein [Vibrio europaeus]|uniref:GtrA family protein n=1 Tax=Vibrio europaeus TaxID=300876 RepID=A0AAE7DW20_9VIBR|nr:GtrA family protein [Vibrio europaeus]MDC5803430.1 GtrA family protein [Vibrio europaeus]MDC5823302.1 GtrA family protein [Vibrio europaeus]MDC5828859.1 GtrA family protein [Vibrio europaeus]MDC5833036.1 GtrA family protein [Vibrio europaeus]QJY35813.1 GtrA family protein [Vibrio europaeus]